MYLTSASFALRFLARQRQIICPTLSLYMHRRRAAVLCSDTIVASGCPASALVIFVVAHLEWAFTFLVDIFDALSAKFFLICCRFNGLSNTAEA